MRETQLSVNCLIRCHGEYLFIRRVSTKATDPDVVNILGGRVEPDENYAQTALREAREETGDTNGSYIKEEMEYKGTFIFRGGYSKDWIAHFFRFDVDSKDIPGPIESEEGHLFWAKEIDFTKVANVIWDLPYCWDVLIDDKLTFQILAQLETLTKPVMLQKTVLHEDGYIVSDEKIEL